MNNPHFYSTLSGTPSTQITDSTDYPHSGLIKILSQANRGNYAVKTATDFNITFSTANNFTTIAVTAGKVYRDNKLHTVNALSATEMNTSYNSGTGAVDITPVTTDVYLMLVAIDGGGSNDTMVLRGANTTTNAIPAFVDGDVPIAIIKIVGGSADDATSTSTRMVQYFTTSKTENSVSIAYENSNAYTEAGAITGTSDGLFISGIGTATVAGADKVLIQDTGSSDVIKTVTASSIAALAPQGDITSVVAGSALTGGGTTGDVTLNVGVDDSTIEINSDALRLKDSGVTVGKMAANSVDSDQYVDGSVDNIHLATGIDAVKIADGTVTSEEFQRINTLTSNAQTQLDTKLQVGQFSMWIPAEAISPQSVNPCGSLTTTANANATQPDFRTLAFDAGTDEFAQFSIAMPKMWNEGTVLFTFYWTHAGSAGNDVIWTIAGTSVSNDEAIGGVIFGTAVNYQDTALTAKDLHIISSDTALTIAGSPAVGDVCFFQISRDANNGNDDFASDALLMGVKMTYTVDGLNDA